MSAKSDAVPRLILWDVDGTLLRDGRVAVDAFHRALRAIYGIHGEIVRVSSAGKTDGQVAIETSAAAIEWRIERAL